VKLPNYEHAVVPEAKVIRYLLDLTHPVGRSKAIFFLRFGFTLNMLDVMASALPAHAADNDVTNVETSSAG
jgi:hypothetical protein